MDFKEEVTDPLQVFIKIENEISVKCDHDILNNTIKQIKEETIYHNDIKNELLNEEYNIECIKNEHNFPSSPIKPTSSRELILVKNVIKKQERKKKMYSCLVCHKNFATSLQRELHFNLHFVKNPVVCIFCGKLFIQTSLYISHYIAHILKTHKVHQKKSNSAVMKRKDQCSEESTSENGTNSNRLKKSDCRAKNNFKKLMSDQAKQKRFTCEICFKDFSENGSLKRHMRGHTGEKPFKCKICSKSFIESGSLNKHMRSHTGEKPFKCEICLKGFAGSSNLKSHIRLHTGEKPFKCEVCFEGFTYKNSLKIHMNHHTGEYPFKCEVCSKCFTVSTSLKIHMRCHTGEKPFKCEVCFESFTYRSSLKTHMSYHSNVKFAPNVLQ